MSNFNREDWLQLAAELIQNDIINPAVEQYHVRLDKPIEDLKIAVSIGHPKGKQAIGECWSTEASEDNTTNQIFITPFNNDSLRVLDVLTHELIHAYLDNRDGHKGRFATLARAVDLQGKLTATTAGDKLTASLKSIVEMLGEIPHTKLDQNKAPTKKQKGRMVKIECEHNCGMKFNTSRLQIRNMNPESSCIGCGKPSAYAVSILTALENE
jgi:hypothetical protein